MALSGSSWGTREELLHPRDKRGRFRRKWSLPTGTVDKIMAVLDAFQPKSFGSQQQASQWAFNQSAKKGPNKFQDFARLGADYSNTNADLRAGKMTPSTQKFISAYDKASFESDEDIVLYRKVGPEAFGISPEMMAAEEGGVEDVLTGTTVVDKGFTSGNVGAPIGNAPITMAIAVPKGTKMMAPARSQGDPQVILDRDQKVHISKVEPDGRGGFNVMGIITDEAGPEEHEVVSTGEVPDVAAREADVGVGEQFRARSMGGKEDVALETERAQVPEVARVEQRLLEAEQAQRVARMPRDRPVPQPAAGVAERREPLQSEVTGGRPAVPTPEAAPEEPVRIQDFRQAFRDANIEVPSAGKRRGQFNRAYLGMTQGKRDPEDILRELEADIRDNNGLMDDLTTRDTPLAEARNLEADIDRQEKLADLIGEQQGLERRSPPRQVKPAEGDIPEEGASKGGTDIRGMTESQKDDVVRRVTRLKSEGRFNPDSEENQRLQSVVDQVEAERAGKEIPAPIEPAAVPGVAKVAQRNAARRAATAAKKAAPAKRAGFSEADVQSRLAERGMTVAPAKKAAPVKATEDMTPEERTARLREILRGENVPGEEAAEEADPLESMTKVQLVEEAGRRGISRVPSSWNKTQIKDAIRKGEVKAKAAPATKATSAEATEAGDLEGLLKSDLLSMARGRDIEVKDWWTKDRIKQAIRGEAAPAKKAAPAKVAPAKAAPVAPVAPAAPEVPGEAEAPGSERLRLDRVADGLDLEASPADVRVLKALQEKLDGTSTTFKGNDLGRRLTQAEVADELEDMLSREQFGPGQQARALAARIEATGKSPRPVARQQLERLHESERNWRRLVNRLRGRHQETGINNPAATRRISAEDRSKSFGDAWDKKFANLTPDSAARRSALEIRDDIESGKITPDEGVRRLESDIEFNKEDLASIEADIRGTDDPREIADLRRRRTELSKDIKTQEQASGFLRDHFRRAPEVTPDEVKQALPAPVRKQLDEATPAQLKEAAKLTGMPEPKGDTKEEMADDLLGMLAKESVAKKAAPAKRGGFTQSDVQSRLAERGMTVAPAKKAAPPAPEVRPTPASSRYQRLDINAIGEGLDLNHPDDQKVLKAIQANLDSEKQSPALVGRNLLQAQNSPSGLRTRAGLATGEEADQLLKRANEMEKLGERLQRTRRKANKNIGGADVLEKLAPTKAAPAKAIPTPEPAAPRPRQPQGPDVVRRWQFKASPDIATKTGRTEGDEPLHVPNGGADQGAVHLDSELGQLWIDLVSDNRVPNSKVNAVARMGESLGRGQRQLDGDILPELRALQADAPDSGVAKRIGNVADELTVPERPLNFPEGTPKEIRDWMTQLASIPTMRKPDGNKPSMVDKKMDLISKIAKGDVKDPREALRELGGTPHESVDGGYEAQRITQKVFGLGESRELRNWSRGTPAPSGVTPAPGPAPRDVTPPAPTPDVTPEVTPDEKQDLVKAAELTGIPVERLERRAVAQKVEAAPPAPISQQTADVLGTITDETEMKALLNKKLKTELVDIAKAMGIKVLSKETKPQIAGKIVERRLAGQGAPSPTKATTALMAPRIRQISSPVPVDTTPAIPSSSVTGPFDLLKVLNENESETAIRNLLKDRKFTKEFLTNAMGAENIRPSKGSRSTRNDLVEDLIKNTGSRKPATLEAPPTPAKKAAPTKRVPQDLTEKYKNVTPTRIRNMDDAELQRFFEHEMRREIPNEERLTVANDEMEKREQRSAEEAALLEVAQAPLLAQVDEMVASGTMDYREAYARVFNLDAQEIVRADLRSQLDQIRAPGESREDAVKRLYKENVAVSYVEAEAATNGHMLNPAGRAANVDPFSLFTGPRARAERYASDELKDFWDTNGRQTYSEFRGIMTGALKDVAATRAAREGERGFRR